jgi:hypothetical protein
VTIATVVVLGFSTLPAFAQMPAGPDGTTGARPGHQVGIGDSLPRSDRASNILPTDRRSEIAPTLPASQLGENAATHDYLTSARASLIAGRTGQAQQSLEMAETRALDRSIPQDQVTTPSGSLLVSRIRDARHALGSGDTKHAIELIDQALSI